MTSLTGIGARTCRPEAAKAATRATHTRPRWTARTGQNRRRVATRPKRSLGKRRLRSGGGSRPAGPSWIARSGVRTRFAMGAVDQAMQLARGGPQVELLLEE